MIFFHSVLSLLSFLHPLISIFWISSSESSIHLFLGLHLILLPIGFHFSILLGILIPSIRVTCPSQSIILLFVNLTMSAFPMCSFSSWYFLILQNPFSSCIGPKIFLSIFRSNILSCCSFHLVNVQASHPYVTAGLIKVLYRRINYIYIYIYTKYINSFLLLSPWSWWTFAETWRREYVHK